MIIQYLFLLFVSLLYSVDKWRNICVSGGVRTLLCQVQNCPHHWLLWPPLFPHSYTVQLPPMDPSEATTSLVRLNQIKLPLQWRGYNLITLSSEGIRAYAQPLLNERLNLFGRLIHAMMEIKTHAHSLTEGIGANLSLHYRGYESEICSIIFSYTFRTYI